MTYSGLEVFPFTIDWTQAPNGNWDYDLQEIAIGLGPEIFDPIQSHVTEGWTFSLKVRNADVLTMAAFRLALKGRANPFWLPDPQVAFRIIGAVSTTQFDIAQQNAASTWADNPANVLIFEKAGETSLIGVIQTITDNTTYERVTLAGAIAQSVDSTWSVKRLRLVRNASDRDDYELLAESWERHSFNVVEIANDYGDIETVAAPLFLFHLYILVGATTISWRYTSAGVNVTSDSELYTAIPIDLDGALSRSTDSNSEGCNLVGDYDALVPLALYFQGKLFRPINIEVYEVEADDLDTQTLLFKGVVVGQPQLEGRKLVAGCKSWADAMDNPFPNFPIQEVCPYKVYDPDTCKKPTTGFTYAVTIDSISGSDVVVTGAPLTGATLNLFDQGWLEGGTDEEQEEILIISSTVEAGGEVTLTLTNPPAYLVATDSVVLTLGCNGQRSTCIDRFDNHVNFGGGRTPLRNLSIEGLPIPTTGGGKK